MRLLFIAPTSSVSAGAELARIATGHMVDVVDGLLDRAGLERALRAAVYDAIHFCGHGAKSLLELSDGVMEAEDLAAMLDGQEAARFIIINACDSLSTGVVIHNALHVPVLAMDAPIEDRAAVRFAETFYRAYRRNGSVGEAFDTAKATLLRVFPTQAIVPVLINGDMATTVAIGDCMIYVKSELGTMHAKLDAIGATVDDLKDKQSRTTLLLLVLLIVAQLMTPWLNSLLAR